MLGFSTEDVKDMFKYYQEVGEIPADRDIDAIINGMKPWYDNYCFAKEALETQSRVFNCDMVLYYLRNYVSRGEGPEEMIDPNTKTDYNKMKKLIWRPKGRDTHHFRGRENRMQTLRDLPCLRDCQTRGIS